MFYEAILFFKRIWKKFIIIPYFKASIGAVGEKVYIGDNVSMTWGNVYLKDDIYIYWYKCFVLEHKSKN